ncbi:MAG: Adenylate cyclase [Candidatus Woesebacteria bacterium GW2011_GWB1_43_14]|uniref:Adenylate cyclase n=1 Tax=Candidatus Woesebacteria bacterium GW2011_GWB1_43_14 TaxID=1618578 RepID=A0A0G1DH60_9BACT|nr:MAG: Adenylate/guanylate cyclase with Chase sensor [Candidatus Woesebacteria bacterium GW2011_GWC1_42_9]KKS96927.1 MAG: Adenylate cyclase [Candidatus Woesebacteria bacterium GW2011_GWB1_43_14]
MTKKLIHTLAIGAAIWIALTTLFTLGFFETWQLKLSDTLFSSRPVSSDIVIIAIDDASIQKIGQWPWKRSTHAALINKITDAKVIGLDISFSEESDPAEDQALSDAINNAGNVVLAAQKRKNESLFPIKVLNNNSKVGFTNTIAGTDGITRHIEIDDHFICQISDCTKTIVENGLMRINFVSPPGSYQRYSYVDIASSENIDIFKDKIILIGATAPDLHDNQMTPVSSGVPMDGVEILANAIQTVNENNYLSKESSEFTILEILIITLLLSLLLSNIKITLAPLASGLLFVGFLIYVILSFDNGAIKNIIFPSFAILITTIADIIYKYFSEARQKRFIKKALSYYLSSSVMDEVLKDPNKLKLGGERKNISVLFSDIAGFTTISERLAPEILSQLLNNYLTKMTDIVFKYDGVLDKYIGDAVMAFWGAPIKTSDHALMACITALDMKEALQSIKELWAKEGINGFDVRIGINTGEMVVGNMGSEMRFDYTLIGDNVNLGSRLEGINKVYGTSIIISESTYKRVKHKVVARKLDKVAVKGKKQGITIYELQRLGKPSDKEIEFLDQFENAHKLYEDGDFKNALKEFKKIKNDNPSKIFAERCSELQKKPAVWLTKNWDGIFKAEAK